MGNGQGPLTVRDLMTAPVVTGAAEDTVTEAAAAMQSASVGSVVVVDRRRRVVGILTERDIVRATGAEGAPSLRTVADWMTPDPDVITPETGAEEAFGRLTGRGYRHIPVVDSTELVGIVSMRDLMKVARIAPVDGGTSDLPKGLEGVEVATTSIGNVRGEQGFFHYRQYDAIGLADKRSLEDVWYLLFEGKLPDAPQRQAFMEEIAPLRIIPGDLRTSLVTIARGATNLSGLATLQAALAQFAAFRGFPPALDVDAPALRLQALEVCAIVPSLVAALHRLSLGLDPVDPKPEFSHARNYLYMATGIDPSPDHERALEKYLIATIDHGFNASTFAARVVISTGADVASAVLAGLGALSGPLHGGAPSRALEMLQAIGSKENTDGWIRNEVACGRRLMGFGHRVYKTDDPRSVMLRSIAEDVGGDIVGLAKHVEQRAVAILEELKPARALYPNVEFYAGIVLDAIGLPTEVFTPTFAVSRVVGWTAHVLEQASDNRLIRPSARYIGPEPPQEVPLIANTGSRS